MDHHQWVRARFDLYAQLAGRVEALSRMDHMSARELRARLQADIRDLDEKLGRVDGIIMDNGSQSADHVP